MAARETTRTVTCEDGRLYTQRTLDGKLPARVASETEFFYDESTSRFRFELDEEGRVAGMPLRLGSPAPELHPAGSVSEGYAPRISERLSAAASTPNRSHSKEVLMIRNTVSKLALLGLACLLALSLQAATDAEDPTASADEAFLEALAAPVCEAPALGRAADTGWQGLAALGNARQCTNDKQCVKVCPCLPQCVDGYCANCLWCPPSS